MDLKLQLETLKSCQQDKIPNSLMWLIQDLRESIKKHHQSAQDYKKSFKEAKAAYKQLKNDMLVSENQAKETIQNLSEKVNKLRKMLQVNKRENGNASNESQRPKSNRVSKAQVSISEEERDLIKQRLKVAAAKSSYPCKQIFKTIYIGNLAYSADVSETQNRLRKVFISTRLEKVVVPTTDD